MKRHSGVEKGVLLLAAIFIVFGFYLIIYPQDMLLIHPSNGKSGIVTVFSEHVSPNASRVYGVLSLLLGSGIGWAVLTKRYD